MKTLDTTPDDGENLLVKISGHVPANVVIGRPLLATTDTLVVAGDPSTAWMLEDDGGVSRLVDLDDGTAELTTFYRGREIRRVVRRSE